MRIAQVAPLFESVPPRLYGGTERVVAYLTDELTRLGHEVTLFASADSRTRGRLLPCAPQALRLSDVRDWLAPHVLMMEQLYQRARDFDVIHFHVDHMHFSMMRRIKVPWLTTLHGRLDLPELKPLYHEFPDAPVVSITNAQRMDLPAKWLGTVYHGLPPRDYAWSEDVGDYLAFVGRIEADKGADAAIAIAKAAGLPLRMAGKLEPHNRKYFERVIKPHLEPGRIEYLGEVDEEEKRAVMRNARAVLFPIRWPEPFGLVMIESMASGTPVIAFPEGSVPEVVDHGVTGFIVNGIRESVDAVKRVNTLDRRQVRAVFEKRFSVTTMTRRYLELYERLTAREPTRNLSPRPAVAARFRPPVHPNGHVATPSTAQAAAGGPGTP